MFSVQEIKRGPRGGWRYENIGEPFEATCLADAEAKAREMGYEMNPYKMCVQCGLKTRPRYRVRYADDKYMQQ